MKNLEHITSWLQTIIIIALLGTLIFAVVMLSFAQWEHSQALKREPELSAKTSTMRTTPPNSGCADDHYRVTGYVGSFQSSIPVWSEKGVVRCGPDGFTVNGEPITEQEVNKLAGFAVTAVIMIDALGAGPACVEGCRSLIL